MTALIKDRHDSLFKSITAELLVDLGGKISVTIKRENTSVDCSYCEFDTPTGRSSGRPTPGKVWADHADFSSSLRCPECFGRGRVVTYTETILTSNHIEDISGQKFTKGKLGYFPAGTKRLTGLISDVEIGGENYLETAVKITIGTEDYALVSGGGGYERLGIKTEHLFRAILERTEIIEK